jgi:hypothetical protein
MKLKKSISIFLLIVLLISQFSFIKFNNFVYAVDEQTSSKNDTKFHYNQLNSEAKKIYSAMYEMYTSGVFKTGTQNYDLSQNDKYVTQSELQSYTNGNTILKDAMNAARYAFYADYPEVFYVNFQKLNLRVTKGNDDRYHAYIGSGNKANYYIEGFTNQEQVEQAITDFNNKVNEIVAKVESTTVEEGKNPTTEKIKYAHNEIINNTGYRLESDCTPGNEGFLGTPYGALVKQQAVCEGYARALKTVLDKLGINSILVQGTHQSEGSAAVPHMWNYVEIEKETLARSNEKVWYAVDSTMDDPFLRKTAITPDAFPNPGDDIVEGFENTRYCLVGTETMNKEHVAIETVEAAGNYVFKYPQLNVEDYGIDAVTNSNGLFVKYKQDGTQTEEYKAGDYYISYNGKGYAEAAKEGKYMIMKSYYYRPGDEEWDVSPWAYFLPDVYAGGFRDYDDHIYLTMPNSEYVEFAVTTLEPGDYQHDLKYLAYQGDESDFVARSQKLYNPSGTYKGKPYIKTQTPAATATLTVGPTYHVDVTYDDDLVFEEGVTEAGYILESTGPTGADKAEITNFTFDGKRRVTFDLKFSKMWADDGASYTIYITGLVGKNSRKAPMEISYGAVNQISCSFRMNKAKNWEVFGTPTLIENEDLSMNEWKTSDGTEVSDKLKSRIALVTTKTTKAETDTMNNLMKDELQNQEMITSETYNISLNVCKKYVVKTGHRLRISLGFPAGYGPDDAGVTFKAYHFIRNSKGEVTGVEEIPCVVTQYGLIVTCDSFSPFAIAVVENDGTQTITEKAVVVSDSEGGTITGANREEGNIVTLKENESRTFNIKADEGHEIEAITVCGEVIEISNKDTMNITVNYNDVKDGNCIVDAKFVAQEVVAQEEAKGEVVVQETAIPANITEMPENVVGTLNRRLTINPTVEEVEGIITYQWYKDGVKLEGKTNKILTIESPTEADEGAYVLKVTTTAGTVSTETTSTPCNVTISSFEVSIELTDSNINVEELKPGQEFEVKVSTNNFKNIGNGLISLTGQLEYDTNILERIDVNGQNGWNLGANSFNEENFKFVIDSEKIITHAGEIFNIKFKVKDTITEETRTTIKVKGISASGGYGIISANDTSIKMGIKIPKEEAKITSNKYVIEGNTISRVAPGITLKAFKENIEVNRDLTIVDKDGNTLNENSVLGTDMVLKVGDSELQYTIVVTGDIDGDAEITTNDLAQLKLDLIDYEKLADNSLKAADVDNDGEITVNDVAQIKLVLINLMQIQ